MNLLKKIISGSPLDEYDKLNKEIEALDKYLVPVHDARLERETDLAKARAAFFVSPSAAALNSWETARQRGVGMKNSDSFGSTFSHLETIGGDVEHEVNTWRQSLKSSPKAMQIYLRCLQEIGADIRKNITTKRAEIGEKLRGVGAAVDIESVQPLPLWTGRATHLDSLVSQLDLKMKAPGVLSRQGLIDEARAAIEADHLNAPAPTPFIPRQQQAWPPGTSFAAAGVAPDAPPVAPAAVNAVPKEIDLAIRAKLVREQNTHFANQQAQFEARMEGERAAAANRAKEAQAQPVPA